MSQIHRCMLCMKNDSMRGILDGRLMRTCVNTQIHPLIVYTYRLLTSINVWVQVRTQVKQGTKHRRILSPEFLLKEALSAHIPVFIQRCLKKLWLHVGWIPCIDNKCIWQCSVVYFKVTEVLMHVLSRKPVFTASWHSQNLKVMIITACMRFYFPN